MAADHNQQACLGLPHHIPELLEGGMPVTRCAMMTPMPSPSWAKGGGPPVVGPCASKQSRHLFIFLWTKILIPHLCFSSTFRVIFFSTATLPPAYRVKFHVPQDNIFPADPPSLPRGPWDPRQHRERFRSGYLTHAASGAKEGKMAAKPNPPTCVRIGYITLAVWGDPKQHNGGQDRKWPTCRRFAYITLSVQGFRNASLRGTKSQVAHMCADRLHHPCRHRQGTLNAGTK